MFKANKMCLMQKKKKKIEKILALSDLNDLRQLSGRLSITRFLGLKLDGNYGDGYPLQCSTLRLFGRF